MERNVITPVATEPITLIEAKLHLRATSETFSGDLTTSQSIAPGSHGVSTVTGAAVDVLGKAVVVVLNTGICSGSVAAHIEESDDNTNWQDFTGGAFTAVTTANDNAMQEKAYTGIKQYVRVIAVVTGAAGIFSADVIAMSGSATEDTLIQDLITAAREHCEDITGRALATQTIEAYPEMFPCADYFELPCAPLQSVTSITYKNSAGTVTTMTVNTDYLVNTKRNVGRVTLPYGKIWPSFTAYPDMPIIVTYVAGYSASNPIPKSIKQAMLLLIGHWYANREAVLIGAVSKNLEFAVMALLSMHRVRWF